MKLNTEKNFLRPVKGVEQKDYLKSSDYIDIFGSQLEMNMFQRQGKIYPKKPHSKEIHSHVKANTLIAGIC